MVLTRGEIDHFTERGWVAMRGAFSRATAARVREALWAKLDVERHDRSTWKKPVIHLLKNFSGRPYTDAITARLRGAVDDLLGERRWKPLAHLGWWPVAFPGHAAAARRVDWHVDGGFFHHRLAGPQQGLLPLFLFSDIAPGGGGTLIAEGSHRLIARALHDAEPEGLTMAELMAISRRCAKPSVLECTGEAGDVMLVHPFLIHGRGPHRGTEPRFICNPCISLRRAPSLERPVTPLERSIAAALPGVPRAA